jgi:hypothetical protein
MTKRDDRLGLTSDFKAKKIELNVITVMWVSDVYVVYEYGTKSVPLVTACLTSTIN